MAMYHDRTKTSMGSCTSQEEVNPSITVSDAGVEALLSSATVAQSYAEGIIKPTTKGVMKMKKNAYGLEVTTWPTTPAGCHMASYPGWDGPEVIINAGGWVNGEYVDSSEVESAGLWDRLSPDVRDEMESLRGEWPGYWNDRILDLRGHVSHEDEELLDALWISGEVFNNEVTIYGTDASVSNMDEDDLYSWGLNRVESDYDDDESDEDE